MKRRPLLWIAAIVTVSAMAAPNVTSAQRGSDVDHARLTAMAGAWDLEMTFWLRPGGAGIPSKGTSTISPLFDGRYIEEKIEGTLNGAPFTTLAWTGFNPEMHQYQATRIS